MFAALARRAVARARHPPTPPTCARRRACCARSASTSRARPDMTVVRASAGVGCARRRSISTAATAARRRGSWRASSPAQPFAARVRRRREPQPAPHAARRAAARAMGARVRRSKAPAARLPMTVHGGALQASSGTSETASAQMKSAILLAGALRRRRGRPCASRSGRAITPSACSPRAASRSWVHEHAVHAAARDRARAARHRRARRSSSAAFFAALAALADGGDADACRTSASTRRAPGFFFALARMGARLVVDGRAPGGRRARRHGRRVAGAGAARHARRRRRGAALIDELPLLACVAARADGETRRPRRGGAARQGERPHRGGRREPARARRRRRGAAGRLRRARPRTPSALRGRSSRTATIGSPWRSASSARSPATRSSIDDPDCVAVSYPGFWADLGGSGPIDDATTRTRGSEVAPAAAMAARGRHRRARGVGQVVHGALGRRAARATATWTPGRSTARSRYLALQAGRRAGRAGPRRSCVALAARVSLAPVAPGGFAPHDRRGCRQATRSAAATVTRQVSRVAQMAGGAGVGERAVREAAQGARRRRRRAGHRHGRVSRRAARRSSSSPTRGSARGGG